MRSERFYVDAKNRKTEIIVMVPRKQLSTVFCLLDAGGWGGVRGGVDQKESKRQSCGRLCCATWKGMGELGGSLRL